MSGSVIDANRVVQALWVGSRLSALERLSMASFLAHGHEYHLYTYGHVEGVPPGIIVRDGNDVLTSDWLFRDSRGTFAGFSDFFRYKLLLASGGWWVDTDMVCLKPFDFEPEYVLANEPDLTVGSAVMKVPARSELIARAWEACAGMDRTSFEWGAAGPRLLIGLVERLGLTDLALEPNVFFPVDWGDWRRMLDPAVTWVFAPSTRAIHLWSSMWSLEGQDPDLPYPRGCLLEDLKARYLTRLPGHPRLG